MTPLLLEYDHNDFSVVQIFFMDMLIVSLKKGLVYACTNEEVFKRLASLTDDDSCVTGYIKQISKIAMIGLSPLNFDYLLLAEYAAYSANTIVHNRKVMLMCTILMRYLYGRDIDGFLDVIGQLSPMLAKDYALKHFYPELTPDIFKTCQLNPSENTLKTLEYFRQMV